VGQLVRRYQVHNQLAAQNIVFPAANSAAIKALPPADAAAMKPYTGQLMTNGAQAETWADHFIAVHLVKIGGGKTYSQLSAESLAQPKNTALAAPVQTVFQGTTLRGLLLTSYAMTRMVPRRLVSTVFSAALKCAGSRRSSRIMTPAPGERAGSRVRGRARVRAARRDFHHLNPGTGQHRIEPLGEPPGPVPDQEPEPAGAVPQIHQQVPRLTGR
jgi:hypothetical protein